MTKKLNKILDTLNELEHEQKKKDALEWLKQYKDLIKPYKSMRDALPPLEPRTYYMWKHTTAGTTACFPYDPIIAAGVTAAVTGTDDD